MKRKRQKNIKPPKVPIIINDSSSSSEHDIEVPKVELSSSSSESDDDQIQIKKKSQRKHKSTNDLIGNTLKNEPIKFNTNIESNTIEKNN